MVKFDSIELREASNKNNIGLYGLYGNEYFSFNQMRQASELILAQDKNRGGRSMNERDKSTRPKKLLLKEPSFLIGIGGLLVTIIVGLVTYWLTTGSISREYKERINAGRNYALTAIAKSIGEGVVPSKTKIKSVLNSVRRQYGIREQDFESPETIIDDLLARILSNEFLDAKRREELSDKLLTVKAEKLADLELEKAVEDNRRQKDEMFFSYVLSFLAALLAAITLVLMSQLYKRRSKEKVLNRDKPALLLHQFVIIVIVLALIIIGMWRLIIGLQGIFPFLNLPSP